MTQHQIKHGITEELLNKLFFYPIEYKYSALKEERETATECFNKSDNEEEKKELRDKLQWLHEALLVIEKAIPQNCHNRRYEPLEIPNVVPTPTEQVNENLQNRLNTIDKYFNKKKGEFKHPSKRTINCIGFDAAYSSPEAQEHLAKQRKEIEDFNKNN